MPRDVFWQIPAWHPIRDEFERFSSYSEKGNDVWVDQVLRQYSDLIEGLWFRGCLMMNKRGTKNVPPLLSGSLRQGTFLYA